MASYRDYAVPNSVSAPLVPEEPTDRSSKQAVAQDSAAKGAVVREYDPEATPQDKAAATLLEAKSKISPIAGADPRPANVGTGLVSDLDLSSDGPAPTVNLADAEKATAQEAVSGPSSGVPEGRLANGKVADIPEDAQVGWSGQKHIREQQAAGEKIKDVEAEEAPKPDPLSTFLADIYYGTDYHNAAIIFFAIGASHYLTRFGGGLFSCLFVAAVCATYYSTSIKRVRHRARDDIERELAKTRLYTEHESADWINNFLRRFWLAYEPLLSATIVMAVDQVLSESCPAFLESLRLTTFTLGTKGPRLDFIKTFPDTEDDVVVMDIKLSFTPADIADLTPRQAAGKVNPKIVLAIKIGKGMASVGKDILTEDIAFTGVMRVKLKLMSNFPNIKTVELSFLEKPVIDFVLKPIGFDINMIPGLANFIDGQIHANLGPMMYSPNSFALDLEQLLSGAPIDSAIGVVQITLFNARGLKGVKMGGGAPDPYVSVSISQRAELAKTKTKHSTVSPHWNETKFILVNSLNDVLTLTVKDWNERRKDMELGVANFDLKTLEADPEQEHVQSTVTLQGKDRGVLNYAINYYPTMTPKKLENGSEEAIPETTTGIVRLTIHQAKELDHKKSISHSQLNPYARLFLQHAPIHSTRTLKRTTSPAWEDSYEFLVTDKAAAVIGLKIIDERGLSVDPMLGYLNIKLADLLEAKAQSKDWFPLSGCATGRVRISAEWKAVMMAGAINGSRSYRPPIGVVRFWIKRAIDLKNVEALTGGKSDPYLRILRAGIPQAKTEIVNNNLNPEWDEVVYVPVHNTKEKLILEVMDYEHTGKDRSLGSVELDVGTLMTEDAAGAATGNRWKSSGKQEKNEMLRIDGKRNLRGTLFYEANFYPCAEVGNIQFDAPPTQLERIKADDQSDTASTVNTVAMGHHEEDAGQEDGDFEADAQRIASATRAAPPITNGIAQPNGTLEKTHRPSGSVATQKSTKEAVSIPRDVLLATQSGILVTNIVGGNIARKGARLEILFDSGYWPAHTTEKARSTKTTWDEVHETFIKELDYSRIIFKLNEAEKETTDETYAELALDMNEFLETALDKPTEFCLTDNRGLSKSYITVCAKYIPVNIQIEPRESVNNTGLLRVDLVDASGLRAADRSGSSDPYAVFELGGEKLFKSAVQKRTLKPVWNETFECPIPSRASARFFVKIYDWDAVGKPDKLGMAQIDLSTLEPFTATPLTLQLQGDGEHKASGEVSLRLVFRPEFITRVRAATSGTIGRVGTNLGAVGSAGYNVVGGVGKGVGKGVGTVGKGGVRVVSGVGHGVGMGGKAIGKGAFGLAYRATHGGHARNKSSSSATAEEEEFMAAGLKRGHTAQAAVIDPLTGEAKSPTKTAHSEPVSGTNGYSTEEEMPALEGRLNVTITGVHVEGAEKTLVVVKQNGRTLDKTHPSRGSSESQFGDTFHTKTTSGPSTLEFIILEKKKLGKDKQVATAEVSVWDYLSPSIGTLSASPAIPLVPDGSLQIQLDWKPEIAGGLSATDSPASIRTQRTSRFSMMRTPDKNKS